MTPYRVPRSGPSHPLPDVGAAMNRTMTVDRLIAEAKQNSTGTGDPDTFEPEKIAFALRIALDFLLGSIDYERNQSDGTAVAARILATLVARAQEIADAKKVH